MELLTILLSGLLTLVSPAGIVVDATVVGEIRERLYSSEELQVRIDNIPSYQLLQGKVERMRIAGRGLWLTPEVRVDTLDLETDPIDIDRNYLGREGLRSPAAVALHLVLTEADINRALSSPEFLDSFQSLLPQLFNSQTLQQNARRYRLVNPQVRFLGQNRVRLETEIEERGYADRLKLTVETGISLARGRRLRLLAPAVLVNGRPAPGQFVKGLIAAARRFDLQKLEEEGAIVRFLQFNLTSDRVEIAIFARFSAGSQTAGLMRVR